MLIVYIAGLWISCCWIVWKGGVVMSENVKDLVEINRECHFPCGKCLANRCRDCRYMEMDNDHYNDGTRRCSYKGQWISPSSTACANFSW